MLKTGLMTSMVLAAVVLAAQVVSLRETSAHASWELSDSVSGDELREEFHQTIPISPNGRLSLENINGNVTIKVWDRNEIQVDAVKSAYRKERLNEVKIDISATPDVVRIRTTYPDFDQTFTDEEKGRNNNPASVDYSLTVPRQVRLESVDLINGSLDIDGVEGDVKASSVNGRVRAQGLKGEAKLSTINGSLEANFTSLDATKAISLGSVNGGVTLVIPSNANATLRASTVHGAISNDFGLEVQHGEYVGHELYGQLGTGGTRIKLGNVNGQIVIKHAADGGQLSPATSLMAQKEKNKEKNKEKGDLDDDTHQLAENARRVAQEAAREARASVDQARIAQEAQAQAQRDVDQAMREAQREVQRAQLEAQRETERQIREAQREIQRAQQEVQRETERAVREQMRHEGKGAGSGKGQGEGTGSGRVVDHETKSFIVSGSPRVNAVTYDGAITVHGWDKSEVMYNATKRADDEDELKSIKIRSEQQGSAVSIIAGSDESVGSVTLDVYVPRNATLHISSDDGRLSLQGVSGDLTLRTGDGQIQVSDGHGQLQVNTGDGQIRIANFEGQVDARTGDGSITVDGKFAGLAARTGDGSITLSVPADSHFTIETNAEAISNEGLTVSEDVAPSTRVKRWKVGQGGNVFILSTGDGHIILRPR